MNLEGDGVIYDQQNKYVKNTSKIKLHFKYIELDMTIYPYKQRDVGYFKMLFVIMRGFPLENNKKECRRYHYI